MEVEEAVGHTAQRQEHPFQRDQGLLVCFSSNGGLGQSSIHTALQMSTLTRYHGHPDAVIADGLAAGV
jgi:hypothetical protein